jgi:hypothetical protein
MAIVCSCEFVFALCLSIITVLSTGLLPSFQTADVCLERLSFRLQIVSAFVGSLVTRFRQVFTVIVEVCFFEVLVRRVPREKRAFAFLLTLFGGWLVVSFGVFS